MLAKVLARFQHPFAAFVANAFPDSKVAKRPGIIQTMTSSMACCGTPAPANARDVVSGRRRGGRKRVDEPLHQFRGTREHQMILPGALLDADEQLVVLLDQRLDEPAIFHRRAGASARRNRRPDSNSTGARDGCDTVRVRAGRRG